MSSHYSFITPVPSIVWSRVNQLKYSDYQTRPELRVILYGCWACQNPQPNRIMKRAASNTRDCMVVCGTVVPTSSITYCGSLSDKIHTRNGHPAWIVQCTHLSFGRISCTRLDTLAFQHRNLPTSSQLDPRTRGFGIRCGFPSSL